LSIFHRFEAVGACTS
jgi:hypothetical protein